MNKAVEMFNTIKNKLLKLSLEDFNKDFGHQMEMGIEVENGRFYSASAALNTLMP